MAVKSTLLPLNQLQPGKKAFIRKIIKGESYRRMLDMGLVPDTLLKVIREAPMGGPLAFRVRDFYLSLRKSEAQNILVEEVE
ncbi:MAG: iron transporter FeoA [Firmicutes bacterium HGW-Firmicutes-13]|nr:MAG: iron transporter FeoA [Firmicutes bacterium HGW-Firmicutes-13]